MILVDTSVWVEHLRRGHPRLGKLLVAAEVLGHPFVLGEIALGHLRRRVEILGLFAALPQAEVARHDEVLAFVEQHHLPASGIGWVDAHLLAAALLADARLWSVDRALISAARSLGVAFPD